MLKSDLGKSVLIATVISIIIGVWGYFEIQAQQQIETELAAVGVITQATIIECSNTMSSCSAILQYEVPIPAEQNSSGSVISKIYTTDFSMSCSACYDHWGDPQTIRYLPRDPTQIRLVPFGADSNYMLTLIILMFTLLWLGVLIAFINSILKKWKNRGRSSAP